MKTPKSHRQFIRNITFSIMAAVAFAAVQFAAPSAQAQNGTWNVAGGGTGTWSGTSNWVGGIVAGGIDSTADFSIGTGGGTPLISFGAGASAVTLGSLITGGTSGNWTIGSFGNKLTLQTSAGTPTITTNLLTTIRADLIGTQGFTKSGTATLQLSGTGTSTLTGTITVSQGALKTTSTTALASGVTVDISSGALLNVDGGGTLANTITGAGAVSKTNSGNTLTLNGNNTFSGGFTLSDGRVYLGTGTNNGIGTGNIKFSQFSSGIFASSDSAARTIANTLDLSQAGTTTFGDSIGGVGTGDLTFTDTGSRAMGSGGRGFVVNNTTTVTFNNIFTGAQPISKSGSGTLVFNGTASTYTGVTTISGGVFSVAKLANGGVNSTIGASTNVATNLVIGGASGATLQYTGAGDSTNRLFSISGTTAGASATLDASGSGAVNFTNPGAIAFSGSTNQTRTLILTGTNTGANTLSATLGDNGGSGATSLTKNGSGKWVLTGSNSYTGATTVNGGTLAVNGSIGSSATTINSTGILTGSGTAGAITVSAGGTLAGTLLTGAITGSGTVAPGNSPGILTATSATLGSGGESFAFELTGTGQPTWGSKGASGNDVLHLTDSTSPLVGSGTTSNVFSIYLKGPSDGVLTIGATYIGGIFTDKNSDFASSLANANFIYYVLDDASGAITYNSHKYDVYGGTVQESTVQIPSATFTDSTGNTVTNGWAEQFTVVPEPSTFAMALGGFGMLIMVQRMRSRRI